MKYLNVMLGSVMTVVLLHGYYQLLKPQENRFDRLNAKADDIDKRLNLLLQKNFHIPEPPIVQNVLSHPSSSASSQ